MSITGRDGALPIGQPRRRVAAIAGGVRGRSAERSRRRRSKRYRLPVPRPDGRVIELGLSVAALPLPDGSRGYLYTFQDVTDVKRFEQNARLQQRLAAVGEMAAGIAHEIRNPLASMSGSMQMLEQELPLSSDQAQLMDIVLQGVRAAQPDDQIVPGLRAAAALLAAARSICATLVAGDRDAASQQHRSRRAPPDRRARGPMAR